MCRSLYLNSIPYILGFRSIYPITYVWFCRFSESCCLYLLLYLSVIILVSLEYPSWLLSITTIRSRCHLTHGTLLRGLMAAPNINLIFISGICYYTNMSFNNNKFSSCVYHVTNAITFYIHRNMTFRQQMSVLLSKSISTCHCPSRQESNSDMQFYKT